jgi:hypothetical protein
MTNIYNEDTSQTFDQDLNTFDSVNFVKVNVSNTAITEANQLATRQFVIDNGGGGGAITLTNSGTGETILNDTTNPSFSTKGIISGTGITTTSTATDITLTNSLPSTLISLTNSGSGNTILNSTLNPSFSTKSITAGSNISILTTATDLTISSTASSSSTGLNFNPIQNATTTSGTTGNKSYFYQVLVTQALTISGFKVLCSIGGDPIRVGIYRGAVDNAPLSNGTLVGQSTSTVTNSSYPYVSGVITAIAGQNLTFSAGEIMVIGFHSQGITNVFYNTVGIASLDIAFVGNFNAVAGGFTSPLTSVNQSATLTIRVCFSLT